MTAEKETLLGIDYGSANIGLAFGKEGVVAPLKVVDGKNAESALDELTRIILENEVDRLIVGLPLTVDGKETPQSLEVRKFVKLLKIRVKKPVVFVNEYESTKDSVQHMLRMGYSKKSRRVADDFSAAVILKQYYG